MPKLTIDGKEVVVQDGTSILEAAKSVGIDIPHFCYHPFLSIAGNCRMCMVEIEKNPKLQISCATPVAEGMVVHTQNERVKKARRGIMEFLLVNHPIDCPICDQAGECYLQNYYMQHDLAPSRVPLADKVHKPKRVELGEIVLDAERCVLCARCVRFFNEVTKTGELALINRGTHSEITSFQQRPVNNPYSGNVIEICPVGALTSRDFRFKERVWYLKSVPSVCPTCSTGCNTFIDHNRNKVWRFRSRTNPAVNQGWLCDEGRFSYPAFNIDNRIIKPRLLKANNGAYEDVSYERAADIGYDKLVEITQKSGGAGIAFIAVPQIPTEELFALKYLAAQLFHSTQLEFRYDDGYLGNEKMLDAILRRADKNPNSKGAMLLNFGRENSLVNLLERVIEGKIQGLYILGADFLDRSPHTEWLRRALEKARFVVMHAARQTEWLKYADLVIPALTLAEQDGTLVNYAGRVQRVQRAIMPPEGVNPAWFFFNRLLGKAGLPVLPEMAGNIFNLMAGQESAFTGLTYETIGDHGILVK
jgi:NADH-quinone oxidoreductase subunit G